MQRSLSRQESRVARSDKPGIRRARACTVHGIARSPHTLTGTNPENASGPILLPARMELAADELVSEPISDSSSSREEMPRSWRRCLPSRPRIAMPCTAVECLTYYCCVALLYTTRLTRRVLRRFGMFGDGSGFEPLN